MTVSYLDGMKVRRRRLSREEMADVQHEKARHARAQELALQVAPMREWPARIGNDSLDADQLEWWIWTRGDAAQPEEK